MTIHPTALFFGREHVRLGRSVRIDAYAVLSASAAGVTLGAWSHMGVGTQIFAASGRVAIGRAVGISSRVSIFTGSDDYTGGHLCTPTLPDPYRNIQRGDVTIEEGAVIGCGSVILPGVTIGRGAAVGALSIIKHDVAPFTIVCGPDQPTPGVAAMTPRLVLVTLLFELPDADGSALDTLPQWMEHYRALGVTEIRTLVSLHQAPGLPDRLRGLGVPVTRTTQTPPDHPLRLPALRRFIRAGRPDWYLKADPDEFQEYPLPLPELIPQLDEAGHNVLLGKLVDHCHASGEIVPFDTAIPIATQFPARSQVPAGLASVRRKVMLARGDVRLRQTGAHAALGERPAPLRGTVRHYPYHGDLDSRPVLNISSSYAAKRRAFRDWYGTHNLFGHPRLLDNSGE